ncbi:PIN domain-containing protein [Breznakiellaceae bacterium SP9]
MDVPTMYLETTMFSFYYGQDATPEYRQYKADTRAVFDLIKAGKYEAFTSSLATDELTDEPDEEKRQNVLTLIPEYGIKVLFPTDETQRLAELYIREAVVSPVWETDAAHIAVTAVNGLDFIVSLNFTHIVRPWTIERVNFREGYKPIGIYKPSEILEL